MDSGSRSGLILRAGVSKQPGEEREGGEMRAIGSASEGSAIRESVITTPGSGRSTCGGRRMMDLLAPKDYNSGGWSGNAGIRNGNFSFIRYRHSAVVAVLVSSC